MSDTSRPPPPKIRAEMLRDVGLFGGLDDESLRVLAEQLPVMMVEPGAAVVDEGDDRQEMFLVIAGELEVVKRGRGGEFRVALFGPGDCFGEMSLIDVQPRSATVRAVAHTLMLRMTPQSLEELLYRRDPKAYSIFIMNIARELSRRLRVADGILAQFVSAATGQHLHD